VPCDPWFSKQKNLSIKIIPIIQGNLSAIGISSNNHSESGTGEAYILNYQKILEIKNQGKISPPFKG
jgi:hypothetical protein